MRAKPARAVRVALMLWMGLAWAVAGGQGGAPVLPAADQPAKRYGLCYGPFRDNENPDGGIYPTIEALREDLSFTALLTARIRTYGNGYTQGEIPALCDGMGLECYVGAWIGKYRIENEREVEGLLRIAGRKLRCVGGLIVGNEVLLRKDLPVSEMSLLLQTVNDATEIPVGTAETWSLLVQNPGVARHADFLLVHIHPYWDGIAVDEAAEYVIRTYEKVKALFPGKQVIIGETGWPSGGSPCGKAIPGKAQQRQFLTEFLRRAGEQDIPYFYFEVFDEGWKAGDEGNVGPHWGVLQADGTWKAGLAGAFPTAAASGLRRPARAVEKTVVGRAPLVVWAEGRSGTNAFEPTGWMGDRQGLAVDRDWRDNPQSGESCLKIAYAPSPGGVCWAGIYWQYPVNNWGAYPGYDLSRVGIGKVTFWARGEAGGEDVEFKVGGINRAPEKNRSLAHEDSFGPAGRRVVLTKEWTRYEINLAKEDLSHLIGGFCWVASRIDNSKGCTLYVDEIQLEP